MTNDSKSQVELLYKTPTQCPANDCNANLIPMELLTHVLMHHSPSQFFIEVKAEKAVFIELAMNQLQAGHNHALAYVAYVGLPRPGLSQPVTSELQILHQLPIILMLYVYPPATGNEETYAFYLVSPGVSRKVCASITLVDEKNTMECKGLRCIVNTVATELSNSSERVYCGLDYLVFTTSVVKGLTERGPNGKLYIKVSFQGDPDIFECENIESFLDRDLKMR